ncbi:MAG: CSLREA domain-containing protein, partial [Saprospiraceae bacterium]
MRILLTFAFFLLFVVGIKAQRIYEVTTVDDIDDGVCNAEHCSLREAINVANADGVNSLIWFKINGPGTKVITLDTELPAISDRLKIDGNTLASNLPTTGRLVLDGNGLIKNGLHLATSKVEIYGVQFQQFFFFFFLIESPNTYFISEVTLGKREKGNIFIKNGNAVSAKNLQDLVFQANYVGTNLGFEEGLGNQNGIIVDNSWIAAENSLLIIGGESDRLQHNYFASSTQVALSLSYQGIATIEGNTFGTGKIGNEDLGNTIAVQTKNG